METQKIRILNFTETQKIVVLNFKGINIFTNFINRNRGCGNDGCYLKASI